jgi:hypothetical protein
MLDKVEVTATWALAGFGVIALLVVITVFQKGTGLLGSMWFRRSSGVVFVGGIAVALALVALGKKQISLVDASFRLGLVVLVVRTTLTVCLLGEAGWLTDKFGKTWVKALDFPYIVLAFAGIVRTLNKTAGTFGGIDSVGLVVVAVALGIRMCKSTLEVFFERHIAEAVDRTSP